MLGIVLAVNEDFFGQGDSSFDETLGGEETSENEAIIEDASEENVLDSEESLDDEDAIIIEDYDEDVLPKLEYTEKVEEETSKELDDNAIIEENPEGNIQDNPNVEPDESDLTEIESIEPEISVDVTSENSSIYKGYLYANATSSLRYATDYNTIDTLNIAGGKSMSSLSIQDEPDKMQMITNTKIGLMDQVFYRKTRVSVNEFNNILGNEGYITIYSPENEVIGTIDKNTGTENGEYIFIYSAQFDSVRFELSSIANDGVISIKNDKSIKESTEFSRNQISLFSSINTISQVSFFVGDELKELSFEGNITLEETESRMDIDLDTQSLSVESENEVAINITLRTDEEKYDLFENPSIDLEFPSQIETVDITGMMLLYKNGLSIDNWNITANSVGRKVLRINLSGAQLEYTPGALQEGTTVVAYTKINVNRLTADTSENLKMTFTNKDTTRKSYSLEGKDSEDVLLSFVGRRELVRAMEIKDSDENRATTYDDKTEKIQLKPNQEQKLTITNAIVNNFDSTLTNVEIVGRLPFTGNKDGNENDLGTNFEATLENAIATSGVVADVYYSEDGTVESTSDSWKMEVEDFSQIKSYKIVLREGTLAKGERLGFEYSLVVPESVGYNAKGYTSFTAYYRIDNQRYKNQCSVGMFTEEKEIELEDISEEERQNLAELTIGTQVSACRKMLGETDTVYERQMLEYTVVVKNTSDITAQNVVLKCNAENSNLYYFKTWWYDVDEETVELEKTEEFDEAENVESNEEPILIGQYTEDIENEKQYEEFVIPELKPGEEKTFTYQVIIKELMEEDANVFGKILVSGDNIREESIETIKNRIVNGIIELRIQNAATEYSDESKRFESNNAITFELYVKNLTNEELTDVELIANFSDLLEIKENTMNIENANDCKKEIQRVADGIKYLITIPKINAGAERTIYITAITKEIDTALMNAQITAYLSVGINDETYYSNLFKNIINQTKSTYTYSWSSAFNGTTLNNDDIVEFNFNFKNTGLIDIDYMNIKNEVPIGLQINQVILNDEILDYNEDNSTIFIDTTVNKDSEINLRIITKVNSNLFSRDQSVIENKLSIVSGRCFESFDTNIISYNINNRNVTKIGQWPEPVIESNTNEQSQEENVQNNPEMLNNQNKMTYTISGMAWIDSNQDGIRQAEEEPRDAVIAMLYRANLNGGVDTSSVCGITVTDNQGQYLFDNIEEGNYIIIFDYNSTTYKVTRYQVANAKITENSDAISKKITINGDSRIYGVTDVLAINNTSLKSIDIGLVDKTNFDLSLSKGISKIVVKNSSGIKSYNYNDDENARLEIRSKYYKSSVLDITYNFKITNEGDVAGYVNKVLDYIPDDVEVVLNSSPGWYIGNDNGLYYIGLVDQEIEPGETKEFSLVVRKSLENGEAVKLTNSSEIVEYTNSLGLYDRDSIENNREEKEDDFGKSILTISVSTGQTDNYIVLVLSLILMITVIVGMIYKLKTKKVFYR